MKLKAAPLIITMLALSSVAMAGESLPYNVYVAKNSDGSGIANGAMGATRATTNNVERIGCRMATNLSSSGGVSYSGYCNAKDSLGNYLSCATYNLSMLQSIQAITDEAWIRFKADSNGTCTEIVTEMISAYLRDRN